MSAVARAPSPTRALTVVVVVVVVVDDGGGDTDDVECVVVVVVVVVAPESLGRNSTCTQIRARIIMIVLCAGVCVCVFVHALLYCARGVRACVWACVWACCVFRWGRAAALIINQANTNASAMMIGDKAAEFICADHHLKWRRQPPPSPSPSPSPPPPPSPSPRARLCARRPRWVKLYYDASPRHFLLIQKTTDLPKATLFKMP